MFLELLDCNVLFSRSKQSTCARRVPIDDLIGDVDARAGETPHIRYLCTTLYGDKFHYKVGAIPNRDRRAP